jgi:hypothetical protein
MLPDRFLIESARGVGCFGSGIVLAALGRSVLFVRGGVYRVPGSRLTEVEQVYFYFSKFGQWK